MLLVVLPWSWQCVPVWQNAWAEECSAKALSAERLALGVYQAERDR